MFRLSIQACWVLCKRRFWKLQVIIPTRNLTKKQFTCETCACKVLYGSQNLIILWFYLFILYLKCYTHTCMLCKSLLFCQNIQNVLGKRERRKSPWILYTFHAALQIPQIKKTDNSKSRNQFLICQTNLQSNPPPSRPKCWKCKSWNVQKSFCEAAVCRLETGHTLNVTLLRWLEAGGACWLVVRPVGGHYLLTPFLQVTLSRQQGCSAGPAWKLLTRPVMKCLGHSGRADSVTV